MSVRIAATEQHRIRDIDYDRDRDGHPSRDGFIECTCGTVMRAEPRRGDWFTHRKSLGLSVATIGETIGKRRRAVLA